MGKVSCVRLSEATSTFVTQYIYYFNIFQVVVPNSTPPEGKYILTISLALSMDNVQEHNYTFFMYLFKK